MKRVGYADSKALLTSDCSKTAASEQFTERLIPRTSFVCTADRLLMARYSSVCLLDPFQCVFTRLVAFFIGDYDAHTSMLRQRYGNHDSLYRYSCYMSGPRSRGPWSHTFVPKGTVA